MAISTNPDDPNFGLETDETSPNFGLPEQKEEGGVLSGIAAGIGRALNPVNLIKGALDIGGESDISKIRRYGTALGEIVTGTPQRQALEENIPEVAEQQAAVFGERGGREQAAALTGIGLQAGLLVAPFVHGRLREVAFGEKPTPQIPETPITDVVAPETKITPEEVIPSATQERQIPESNIPEYPGDETSRPPAETGGGGGVIPGEEIPRSQEVTVPPEQPYEVTQTQPNVVPTVPARETGYQPDTTAPKEGEYITAPDPSGLYENVAVGWRQSHEELVKNALNKWKGSPTDVRFHMREEAAGAAQPGSGGAKQIRAQSAALLYELNNNAKTTPKLYRGDGVDPKTGEPYPWSESKEVAQEFAGKGGKIHELPAGQKGLRIQDYSDKPSVFDPEKEWIVRAPEAVVEPPPPTAAAPEVAPEIPEEPAPVPEAETPTTATLPTETPTEPTAPAPPEVPTTPIEGTPAEIPVEPKTPVEPPVKGGAKAEVLEERPIEAPDSGESISWEEATAHGNDWLDKGGDINKTVTDFRRTGKVNPWEMGKMRAYLQRLQASTNQAGDMLRLNPDDPTIQQQYGAALQREQAFTDSYKPMHTVASNTLASLKGSVPLDEAQAQSFTGLTRRFAEFRGRAMTPEEAVKAERITKQSERVNGEHAQANDELYRRVDTEYGRIRTTRTVPPTLEDLGRTFGQTLKEVCET